MKPRFATRTSFLLAAALFVAVSGSAARSQPPPPGGPGFGGPGMGRRPMGGPRPSTAAQTPLAALTAGLKLTDDQKARVQAIQDQLRQQRDALMPRPGQGNDAPPDPETMRANFDRLRAAEQKANSDINAALNDSQKKALPGLLKKLDVWRQAGIPAELYGELNLTDAQEQQIEAIVKKARAAMPPPPGGQPGDGGPGRGHGDRGQARQKMHEQAMEVLTVDQQKAVQDYIDAHPRPPFGHGPGGPGGGFPPPPGGENGGPPPPGGEEGGPPPPPPGE